MTSEVVSLAVADPCDFATFKKELQEAFAVAVVDQFGKLPNGPIPADRDLDGAMTAPSTEVLRILSDGREVGGAVVTINKDTNHNSLDLFFIKVGEHGHGLGLKAWLAIEQRYPETITWKTHTPYFEKRNIHFYVNKCGFKITKFFNPRLQDPHHPAGGSNDLPGDAEDFEFEKVMRSP